MTTLEEINTENENIFINIHEAPYHLTNSKERQLWIKKTIPCFKKEILDFWEIYSSPLPKEKQVILPPEGKQDERRRFIRYPITTIGEKNTKYTQTLGGIWIDNVTKDSEKGVTAEIHIRTKDDQRRLAHPLIKNFLDHAKKNYECIRVSWGNRIPENDPTSFLKKKGFKTERKTFYNSAYLILA